MNNQLQKNKNENIYVSKCDNDHDVKYKKVY